MSGLVIETDGGAVFVQGERVVAGAPPGARRLDGRGAAIRPGAVNAHTHLYSGLAPLGLPAPAVAPTCFVEILERIWWRLDRALDAASLRASARLYLAEALLAGTTGLVDHHESPGLIDGSLDVLADTAEELGARLFVCYGATERNGGRDEGRRGLAECARFLARPRALVRGLVGLHASFTVSDETLREAGALARAHGTVVHAHVAEDGADVEDARRRGYGGPLERLLDLEALPPGSILAHGVWLSEAQVRRAAAAGLWLVQNPRSNAGNRVGYPAALAASPRVAVGTDGYPADMNAEHAALAAEAVAHGDAAWPGRPAGSPALLGELCGAAAAPVAPGSLADLVVAAPGQPPRHVIVGGEVVVEDGRLQRADLDEIRARAADEAPRLWRRMEALP